MKGKSRDICKFFVDTSTVLYCTVLYFYEHLCGSDECRLSGPVLSKHSITAGCFT